MGNTYSRGGEVPEGMSLRAAAIWFVIVGVAFFAGLSLGWIRKGKNEVECASGRACDTDDDCKAGCKNKVCTPLRKKKTAVAAAVDNKIKGILASKSGESTEAKPADANKELEAQPTDGQTPPGKLAQTGAGYQEHPPVIGMGMFHYPFPLVN